MSVQSLRLPNQGSPSPELLTAGMPNGQDLQQLRDAGFKTVINLCPPHETPRDEPEFVASLGMHYINIPVSGPGDLSEANARQLGEAVNNQDNQPALVHCMSSNRVGALLALKAFFVDGKSPAEALQYGVAGGLKALEPQVRQLLEHYATKG